MIRELTCIVCPLGCKLSVELDGRQIKSVKGNTCKRGAVYAENECTNPLRTITTTVKCIDGSLLPVKTNGTIPKDKMFECMEIINKTIAPLPICAGDVIIKDVFGCSVIATKNMI